jgi:hypothetical protein
MSTILQEDLAEAIVINKKLPRDKRKNKKELLVSMGYATSTAESIANKILESKGVKDALSSYGLTEELITTSLVFDIENKPKSRVKELSLGAEILGMKDADSRTVNIQINSYNEYNDAELRQYTTEAKS